MSYSHSLYLMTALEYGLRTNKHKREGNTTEKQQEGQGQQSLLLTNKSYPDHTIMRVMFLLYSASWLTNMNVHKWNVQYSKKPAAESQSGHV